MPTSTTQSIWRSGGGDTTKTAYAGSMLMVADFTFNPTLSSRNVLTGAGGFPIVLPVGAVIVFVATNGGGTGGTSPTIDMGFTLYNTGTASTQSLLNETPADSKQFVNWSSATAGASLGAVMSATEMVYLTGGVGASAATGGTITGRIEYYVPTNGQYTA